VQPAWERSTSVPVKESSDHTTDRTDVTPTRFDGFREMEKNLYLTLKFEKRNSFEIR
jgi:hypothetical protein